jgi:hypothetical protein
MLPGALSEIVMAISMVGTAAGLCPGLRVGDVARRLGGGVTSSLLRASL